MISISCRTPRYRCPSDIHQMELWAMPLAARSGLQRLIQDPVSVRIRYIRCHLEFRSLSRPLNRDNTSSHGVTHLIDEPLDGVEGTSNLMPRSTDAIAGLASRPKSIKISQ